MVDELIEKYQGLYDSNFCEEIANDPGFLFNYVIDTIIRGGTKVFDSKQKKYVIVLDYNRLKLLQKIVVDQIIWNSFISKEWISVKSVINKLCGRARQQGYEPLYSVHEEPFNIAIIAGFVFRISGEHSHEK